MVQYFFENFWMIFQMFLMYENGRGMFYNFGKIEKYWIWGLLKFKEKNRISSRKIPYSQPPQQGASDPISELTGLCSYLFYPNLFPSQINVISTNKQPECPILQSASAVNCFLYSVRTGPIPWS